MKERRTKRRKKRKKRYVDSIILAPQWFVLIVMFVTTAETECYCWTISYVSVFLNVKTVIFLDGELFVVLLAETEEKRRERNERGMGWFVELGTGCVFFVYAAQFHCVLSRCMSYRQTARWNLVAKRCELLLLPIISGSIKPVFSSQNTPFFSHSERNYPRMHIVLRYPTIGGVGWSFL